MPLAYANDRCDMGGGEVNGLAYFVAGIAAGMAVLIFWALRPEWEGRQWT